MNYIEKTLSDNEKIVKIFKFNKLMFILPIAMMILAAILLFIGIILIIQGEGNSNIAGLVMSIFGGVLMFSGLKTYLELKTTNMGVTNKRVVFKKGIFSVMTDEIRLDAVETVEVKQPVIQRMFGFGTVVVTGRGESSMVFEGIDNPLEVKKTIASALNNYSERES